jgi:hypothetical protein
MSGRVAASRAPPSLRVHARLEILPTPLRNLYVSLSHPGRALGEDVEQHQQLP